MMRLILLSVVVAVVRAGVTDHYHYRNHGVSSRASPAEREPQYWADEAAAGLEARLRKRDNRNVARNIIMFIGDGMSVPTIAAARTLLGQRQGHTGEEAQLSFEAFPTSGFAKTYCLDVQIADSACTATAYLCGVKNNDGAIGVNGHVPFGNCPASVDPATHVSSIATWALQDGRDAGVVTTTRITHASPAGAYAHVASRDWESDHGLHEDNADPALCPDIARQLIENSPGNQFKVILGGGRREFLPVDTIDEEGSPGRRLDKRNLIQEWQANKQEQGVSHAYVWNREQLMSHATSPPDYLLGLFESDHMQYHLEANKTTEPTLAELTEIAIKSLSRNEKGFFLFVESGRIDHGHHDAYTQFALDETIQLSNAVKVATEMLSEDDTLIVVTSDHAHVMTFNGYTARGSDILGISDDLDDDGMPYMTLSYVNGPNVRNQVNGRRANITAEPNFRELRWQNHAEVPLYEETHGGDDVGVFALGPHHDIFTGVYEQSQIPFLMGYAGCIGPGPHYCNASSVAHFPMFSIIILAIWQILRL